MAHYKNNIPVLFDIYDEAEHIHEDRTVFDGCIDMGGLPDSYLGVSVTCNGQHFHEIYENRTPGSLEFRIDYKHGWLYLNPTIYNGKKITLDYYSRGIELTPASRIYTFDANGCVDLQVTLQTYVDEVNGGCKFTPSASFENIKSGEHFSTMFGKLARWYTEICNKADRALITDNQIDTRTSTGIYSVNPQNAQSPKKVTITNPLNNNNSLSLQIKTLIVYAGTKNNNAYETVQLALCSDDNGSNDGNDNRFLIYRTDNPEQWGPWKLVDESLFKMINANKADRGYVSKSTLDSTVAGGIYYAQDVTTDQIPQATYTKPDKSTSTVNIDILFVISNGSGVKQMAVCGYKLGSPVVLERDGARRANDGGYTWNAWQRVDQDILKMIGTLSSLTTTKKTDLVSAINSEVEARSSADGNLNNLQTTAKENLVAAINSEVEARTAADSTLEKFISKESEDRQRADANKADRGSVSSDTIDDKLDAGIYDCGDGFNVSYKWDNRSSQTKNCKLMTLIVSKSDKVSKQLGVGLNEDTSSPISISRTKTGTGSWTSWERVDKDLASDLDILGWTVNNKAAKGSVTEDTMDITFEPGVYYVNGMAPLLTSADATPYVLVVVNSETSGQNGRCYQIYFCTGNDNDPNIICYRYWDGKKWSEYEEFGFGSGNFATKGNTSEEEIDSLFEPGIYTVQPSWAIYIGESEPQNDVEPTVVLVAKRPSDNITYQIAFCWGDNSSDGTMDNDEGDYDCILWRSYGLDKQWHNWRQLTSGGGGNITVDNSLNTTSKNPVQNKIIKAALDGKANMGVVTSSTIDKTYAPGIYRNDGATTSLGDLKFVIVSEMPDSELCQIGLIDGDLNGETTFFFAIRVYGTHGWNVWMPMYNGMFDSTIDDAGTLKNPITVTDTQLDKTWQSGWYMCQLNLPHEDGTPNHLIRITHFSDNEGDWYVTQTLYSQNGIPTHYRISHGGGGYAQAVENSPFSDYWTPIFDTDFLPQTQITRSFEYPDNQIPADPPVSLGEYNVVGDEIQWSVQLVNRILNYPIVISDPIFGEFKLDACNISKEWTGARPKTESGDDIRLYLRCNVNHNTKTNTITSTNWETFTVKGGSKVDYVEMANGNTIKSVCIYCGTLNLNLSFSGSGSLNPSGDASIKDYSALPYMNRAYTETDKGTLKNPITVTEAQLNKTWQSGWYQCNFNLPNETSDAAIHIVRIMNGYDYDNCQYITQTVFDLNGSPEWSRKRFDSMADYHTFSDFLNNNPFKNTDWELIQKASKGMVTADTIDTTLTAGVYYAEGQLQYTASDGKNKMTYMRTLIVSESTKNAQVMQTAICNECVLQRSYMLVISDSDPTYKWGLWQRVDKDITSAIGDLSKLKTTNKTNLVNAINENFDHSVPYIWLEEDATLQALNDVLETTILKYNENYSVADGHFNEPVYLPGYGSVQECDFILKSYYFAAWSADRDKAMQELYMDGVTLRRTMKNNDYGEWNDFVEISNNGSYSTATLASALNSSEMSVDISNGDWTIDSIQVPDIVVKDSVVGEFILPTQTFTELSGVIDEAQGYDMGDTPVAHLYGTYHITNALSNLNSIKVDFAQCEEKKKGLPVSYLVFNGNEFISANIYLGTITMRNEKGPDGTPYYTGSLNLNNSATVPLLHETSSSTTDINSIKAEIQELKANFIKNGDKVVIDANEDK